MAAVHAAGDERRVAKVTRGTEARAPSAGWRVLLLVGVLVPAPLAAQAAPAVERGAAAAGLALRQLDGMKRVLMIGAHPDDEDTALLAALARGHGARTAYLSLTRGGGGQNLIGPELDEGLGIVRTGELLAARELDGGEQFFSRAFDFGYSKTSEESFRLWPRDEILADVVWVIRKYRPQVVVSVFPPDERAGHGQHQVAGMLAHEAFEIAGDPRSSSSAPTPWRRGRRTSSTGAPASTRTTPRSASRPAPWIPSWAARPTSWPWRAEASTAPRTWAPSRIRAPGAPTSSSWRAGSTRS